MAAKKENYETMLKALNSIVSDMENKELTLDETMKNYEDGVSLCNKLYKYLNEAEGKIKILEEGTLKDFLEDEEK
jgi:exodeoxyribonuclease VII small subunit